LVAIAQWMMNDLARATFVKERELCHNDQPWPQGAHPGPATAGARPALAPVGARDIAILAKKPPYLADENGPGRIAGQQEVVAALECDEPCSGNTAGD